MLKKWGADLDPIYRLKSKVRMMLVYTDTYQKPYICIIYWASPRIDNR